MVARKQSCVTVLEQSTANSRSILGFHFRKTFLGVKIITLGIGNLKHTYIFKNFFFQNGADFLKEWTWQNVGWFIGLDIFS